MSDETNVRFEGFIGEHRTTGRRAWCFQCSEWCYPDIPCSHCAEPMYEWRIAELEAETFVVDVLRLFADLDAREDLFWHVIDDHVRFFVNCSDIFHWASADLEPLTPEDLPLLHQTIADLVAIDADIDEPIDVMVHVPTLYAARRRKMRPQRPYLYGRFGGDKGRLHIESDTVRKLFEAAGPQRNPMDEG